MFKGLILLLLWLFHSFDKYLCHNLGDLVVFIMLNIFSSVQPNGESDLLLGMSLRVDFIDSTLENFAPPCIKEQGYLVVFVAGDIAKEEFIAFTSVPIVLPFIHYGYGIDIVLVVGIAHKF